MMTALSLGIEAIARPVRSASNPFEFFNFVWLIGPILTIVILAAVFIPLMKRSAERKRLLQTGEAAQAKILGLADTGVLINNNPQVQLVLEVYPNPNSPTYRGPQRGPFQAQCVAVVSYLAIPRVQPGMMVPVRFDPADPSKIALEI